VSKKDAEFVIPWDSQKYPTQDILTLEKAADYKLCGKTGGGPLAEGKYIGWFVGYLEVKNNIYFFAINLEGDSFAAIRDRRIALTKKILTGLVYLPRR